MITNRCVFLLCFFAITSNIKSIESTNNKISPIRFCFQKYHKHYVRAVNSLTTFNKSPIIIEPADVQNLSTLACGSIQEYQLKLKSQDKLEKKGDDIKCSFCAIAKSNIQYMQNLFDMLRRGEPFINNEETVKQFEEHAKIMLRILMLANLETGKWLWTYFLKIIAIRQYYDNKPFIYENPFKDDQLQKDVSDFIRSCIAKNYLPSTAMKSDWVSKNWSIYNDIICDLRASRWVADVLNDRALVTIDFLYLKPFWDDENQLLFKEIPEVTVDWSKPKQLHKAEVAITREFVENRTWIYKPYGRLYHQHLLINIIDARIYCYLSVILHVYEKQLFILSDHTLKHIKDLINNVIRSIMKLTASKDEFLVVIKSEFDFAQISDIDDIKGILEKVRTKANEVLNGLNVASTSGIDRFSYNVNEHQLSTNDLIIRLIKDFEDYLNELVGLPFAYKMILHFINVVKMSAAPYI